MRPFVFGLSYTVSPTRLQRYSEQYHLRPKASKTAEIVWLEVHSMYAIYAYIDPGNHPSVGIYAIHGVFGIEVLQVVHDFSSNAHVFLYSILPGLSLKKGMLVDCRMDVPGKTFDEQRRLCARGRP